MLLLTEMPKAPPERNKCGAQVSWAGLRNVPVAFSMAVGSVCIPQSILNSPKLMLNAKSGLILVKPHTIRVIPTKVQHFLRPHVGGYPPNLYVSCSTVIGSILIHLC